MRLKFHILSKSEVGRGLDAEPFKNEFLDIWIYSWMKWTGSFRLNQNNIVPKGYCFNTSFLWVLWKMWTEFSYIKWDVSSSAMQIWHVQERGPVNPSKPCPKELMSFFEASHICLPGLSCFMAYLNHVTLKSANGCLSLSYQKTK